MKNARLLAVLPAICMMVGCNKEPSTSSTTPPRDSKPAVVSDGTNTWLLGATLINGTNVSTNVTVGLRSRDASK